MCVLDYPGALISRVCLCVLIELCVGRVDFGNDHLDYD